MKPLNYNPAAHQEEALKFLAGNNWSGLLNHDTGTGKTFTAFYYAIALAKAIHKAEGRKAKGIIFCPTNLLDNWNIEAIKHLHPLLVKKIHNFCVSKKSETIKKKADLLIESDSSIFAAGISYLRNADFIEAVKKKGFDFLIVDESHFVKSYKSKQTKGLLEVSGGIKGRVLMTGSPLLNSLADVWTQCRVVKPDLLSKTYYGFLKSNFVDRNTWMKQSPDPEMRKKYFPSWEVLESKRPDLMKKLNSVMHVAKKNECVDLPPYIRQQVFTTMDAETSKAYNEMRLSLRAELQGEELTASNQLVKMMRLQQILAFSRCKQELCLQTLEGINLDEHKVIVWCNFRDPLIKLHQFIQKKLKNSKMLIAHGQIDKSDRFELIKKFDNDPTYRVMFATQGALGTGFELTKASYAYYHSKDYRLGHNLQSEGRNYRRGSDIHDRVVRIDGLVKNTTDSVIHKALDSKKGLHDMAKDLRSFI